MPSRSSSGWNCVAYTFSPDPERLHRALRRGSQAQCICRQRRRRLLVPAVGIEDVGQLGEQWIVAARVGDRDRHCRRPVPDRCGRDRPDDGTQRAHAVTASEERVSRASTMRSISASNSDSTPLLRPRLRLRRIADVVRAAAQDDARPVGEVDRPNRLMGQADRVQPVASSRRTASPPRTRRRRFVLATDRQEQERCVHGQNLPSTTPRER